MQEISSMLGASVPKTKAAGGYDTTTATIKDYSDIIPQCGAAGNELIRPLAYAAGKGGL